MRTIGILGGSFNPPHRGHLALARTVLELALAEEVVLVPAAMPPHKAPPREADPPTRLAMARLLAAEDPRLSVDDLELRRAGPSYSVDTVRQLAAAHPENRYRLIIGSDMAASFASWREYRELLRLAPPLVAERPDSILSGTPEEMFAGMKPEECAILFRGRFAMRPVDMSSTKIRELLRRGADDDALRPFLTPAILAFIRERDLYRAAL